MKPKPMLVTADVAVLDVGADPIKILLIQRKNSPFAGCWALPGGFVDPDESVPDAARRELAEEAGLRIRRLVEVGCFSNPGRDSRGRVITVAYLAFTRRPLAANAGDDADDARWFSVRRLPRLAFDHREIVKACLKKHNELNRR